MLNFMNGFIESLIPFLKKFGIETALIVIASGLAVFSYSELHRNPPVIKTLKTQNRSTLQDTSSTCVVDVSGAVLQPDVYVIQCSQRLRDAVQKAGGFSEEADKAFIARNMNLARYVFDQQKIHIPSIWEVNQSYFIEPQRSLEYANPVPTQQSAQQEKLSINTASAEELQILPGVGEATAQKIISNRPYTSVQDLITKKSVTKTVFEKIQGFVAE